MDHEKHGVTPYIFPSKIAVDKRISGGARVALMVLTPWEKNVIPTNKHIAELVGVSEETVNKIIKELKKYGYLHKDRDKRILFQDPNENPYYDGVYPDDMNETIHRSKQETILYYLKFYSEFGILYKIGITYMSVAKRFANEVTRYDVVSIKTFPSKKEAIKEEKRILKEYSKFKYQGPPFLSRSGDTELFTKDILGLDK